MSPHTAMGAQCPSWGAAEEGEGTHGHPGTWLQVPSETRDVPGKCLRTPERHTVRAFRPRDGHGLGSGFPTAVPRPPGRQTRSMLVAT